MDKKFIRIKEEIERYLDKVLPPPDKKPVKLHKAMRYSVFSGGKRLRPIIILICGKIFNIPQKKLLPVAAGIELIHNFSLIHDDLPSMDNDDFRRGKPTCHKKFGEAIAILAGDSLLTLAFQVISECGKPELIKEIAYAIGSEGMAGGQSLDILYQGKKILGRKKREIDGMKTGKLFQLCFKVPFFFKDIPEKDKERMVKIGKEFGLAFQIRDDIEDREGDIEKLKKNLEKHYKNMKREIGYFGKKGKDLELLIDELYGKFLASYDRSK